MPPVFTLYGDIGWEVTARVVDDFVNANMEEPEIHIRIFSHGGDVFEGFAIMAALSRFPGKKVAFVDGLAASMGSAIMCVCDEVKASEDAFIMVHNPYFFMLDGGDAEELRRQADFLEKVQNTVLAAYQRKSGMSEEDVTAIMAEETWYTAQEAKDAGFVDEIVEPAKMAARVKNDQLAKFKHPPKGLVRVAADAKMRAGLTAAGEDKTKDKGKKSMKLSIKDLQKKFPGMSVDAIRDIIRSVRAAEGESAELPGNQAACEDAGYFWYEDACHKEPKPATQPDDAALAALPDNQAACEDAGYYWYDNSCHEEPQAKAASEGGVPQTKEECEAADMYWYEDACHESPQASASDGGGEPGGDSGKTTTITTTVTTAKMEERIKAAEKHLKGINMRAAKQTAARVFAGCDLSEEMQHDLFNTVVPHCKFVKDGMLDDDAYEAELRKKVEAYGGRIVDGPESHLGGPPMNTPKGKTNGYTREYIKELREGK